MATEFNMCSWINSGPESKKRQCYDTWQHMNEFFGLEGYLASD